MRSHPSSPHCSSPPTLLLMFAVLILKLVFSIFLGIRLYRARKAITALRSELVALNAVVETHKIYVRAVLDREKGRPLDSILLQLERAPLSSRRQETPPNYPVATDVSESSTRRACLITPVTSMFDSIVDRPRPTQPRPSRISEPYEPAPEPTSYV
ncbi:hypothetical protein F4818DRAFT_445353 [Hypoxylon cercidicola]|nr:hypothetical protein F4818DRAFT_445353 [Hypoxylon cercidicola]